ncbi:MAG: PepSY domain-containing protein [Hyphomicrobiales bacterium]|nr:PepSY domain-containing protein [Hyphomicrobiales bacterium]MBV8662762.1 PepSY domain-containing protein [Hyphomicrobiales bacterium]
MTSMSNIAFLLALGAALAATSPAALAGEPEARAAAVKRTCLAPAETREEIKSRHFIEPYVVLKSASTQFKAEALSAKLCHLGDEFVYEIKLLHRDGRLVHAVMDAASGKLLGAHNAHEPMPKM